MTFGLRSWRNSVALGAAVLLIPSLALAAKPKPGEFNPDHESVEMFQAIENGEIAVKLFPKDSTEVTFMIENKTKRPLNVHLPAAMAAVPVLAQIGGGVGGGGRGGGMQTGGMGGMGMGGMGMGGMGGMGGGFFNVQPEQVGKFKTPMVCLEHGKKDPKPNVPYEVKPITDFTDDPAVHQLCAMVSTGQLNQRAAQAAAWHLSNGMSWQELMAKKLRHANGVTEPYFQPYELQAGMQIAATANKLAEKQRKSPGASDSASVD